MTRNSALAETTGNRRKSCFAIDLSLSIDLSHQPHRVSNLIAVKLGALANALDVFDDVFDCTQKRLKGRFAIVATLNVAHPA